MAIKKQADPSTAVARKRLQAESVNRTFLALNSAAREGRLVPMKPRDGRDIGANVRLARPSTLAA